MGRIISILLMLGLIVGLIGIGCSKSPEEDQGTEPTTQESSRSGSAAPDTLLPETETTETRPAPARQTAAQAARESTLMQRLPDKVLAVIATSGGDVLKPGFEQSVIGQIWRDPGVQTFYLSLKTVLLAKMEEQMPLEQTAEFVGFKRLAEQVFKRPVVFGAAQQESMEGPPLYGFAIIDAGPRRAEIASTLSELEGLASKGDIVDVKVGSHTLHGWRESSDIPGYWGWVEDYFVFAVNDTQGLAFQHLSGMVDKSTSSTTRLLTWVPGADDALAMYVDSQKVGQMVQMFAGDQPDFNLIKTAIASLGLSEIKSFTTRIGFAGSGMVSNTLLEAPQPYTGLLKCFQPVNMASLDMVDAAAVNAGIVNIDFSALYDTFLNTLQTTMPPPQAELIQQNIDRVEQQLGIQIRDGLLAGLTGPVTYYNLPPDPDQAPPPQPDPTMPMDPMAMQSMMPAPGTGIMLAELKDAALMEKNLVALAQFAQASGQETGVQVTTQQIGNHTVHTLNIPTLAMMMQLTPSWTIVDNKLIFTTTTEACGTAINRVTSSQTASSSIRTRGDFRKLTANLPQNLLSFSYADSKFQFKQMATLLQQMWPMLAGMMAMQAQINLPMEFPALEKFADQMGPTTSYCWFDDLGIHSHSQGPMVSESGVAAVAAVGGGVAVLLPALSRARELARRVQCASNLGALARAIAMYRAEFRDNYPALLEDLFSTENLDPKTLVCPGTDDQPGQCSYIYRGVDLTASSPEDLILVHDKFENHQGECRNVLFAHFGVRRYTEEEFQQVIVRDNELRRQAGLPEKPADK
ncbi:hypothetical protein ACFL02_02175 [Planctomycetota bacterium]